MIPFDTHRPYMSALEIKGRHKKSAIKIHLFAFTFTLPIFSAFVSLTHSPCITHCKDNLAWTAAK